MRASRLLPTPPSPAIPLADRDFAAVETTRQVPGTASAIGLRRPRSSGTSDAVPLPGGARSGSLTSLSTAGRSPGGLPRLIAPASAQCRSLIAAPEPEVEHDAGPPRSACRATEMSRPSSTKRLPSAIGSPNSGSSSDPGQPQLPLRAVRHWRIPLPPDGYWYVAGVALQRRPADDTPARAHWVTLAVPAS